MTYKEAKTKFKDMLMTEINRLPSHYDAEIDDDVYSSTSRVNEILELNKIVCGALEKADKYRQHNLKKNPSDLPRIINGYGESDYVFVKTKSCNMEIACYSYIKKRWSIDDYVVAWRYIELFEV